MSVEGQEVPLGAKMLTAGSSWRPLTFKALMVEAAQLRGISSSKAFALWIGVPGGDSELRSCELHGLILQIQQTPIPSLRRGGGRCSQVRPPTGRTEEFGS